jgi:hypothetical protein
MIAHETGIEVTGSPTELAPTAACWVHIFTAPFVSDHYSELLVTDHHSVLDLELGLFWGDLIAWTNERAEGVVLVVLGSSPAVHAAEEVNELDQRTRVASRAKPTESSAQSSRDAFSRPAMISNKCCVSNTEVSRVAQTQLDTHIHPRVFHPSHLSFPNRAEWRPVRRRCARFARLSRIRDESANKSVRTRAKPQNILWKVTRPKSGVIE